MVLESRRIIRIFAESKKVKHKTKKRNRPTLDYMTDYLKYLGFRKNTSDMYFIEDGDTTCRVRPSTEGEGDAFSVMIYWESGGSVTGQHISPIGYEWSEENVSTVEDIAEILLATKAVARVAKIRKLTMRKIYKEKYGEASI